MFTLKRTWWKTSCLATGPRPRSESYCHCSHVSWTTLQIHHTWHQDVLWAFAPLLGLWQWNKPPWGDLLHVSTMCYGSLGTISCLENVDMENGLKIRNRKPSNRRPKKDIQIMERHLLKFFVTKLLATPDSGRPKLAASLNFHLTKNTRRFWNMLWWRCWNWWSTI